MRKLKIPNIPHTVDLKDLADVSNGTLISAHNANLLSILLADQPAKRFSKKEIKALWKQAYPHTKTIPKFWGIIKQSDGEIYSIYKGTKHKKHLGKGAFGKVKLAQNILTGEWQALKVQKNIDDDSKHTAEDELKKLIRTGKSKGEFIQRSKRGFFSNKVKYNFIMEYAKGVELYKFLKKNREITAARQLDIAIQAVQKINALHNNVPPYVHCDIKLQNMLYDFKTNELTIVDLGSAKPNGAELFRGRGTLYYMAPEVFPNDILGMTVEHEIVSYNIETDTYSLGVALKEILGLDNAYIQAPNSFEGDSHLLDLISSMTSLKPQNRPSLLEVEKQLKILRNDLLPIMPNVTGIIHYADFLSVKDKNVLVNALKSVDKVIIADDHIRDAAEYLRFIRLLENNGISVEYEILESNNIEDIIKEINNHTTEEKKEQENEVIIQHLCLFRPKDSYLPANIEGLQSIEIEKGKDYKAEIKNSTTHASYSQLAIVEKYLQAELSRLNVKYKDIIYSDDSKKVTMDFKEKKDLALEEKINKRIVLLKNNLEIIQKKKAENKKMNYTELFSLLNKIEKEMLKLQTKKFRHFSRFFQKSIASKVKEITKEIKAHPTEQPRMQPR